MDRNYLKNSNASIFSKFVILAYSTVVLLYWNDCIFSSFSYYNRIVPVWFQKYRELDLFWTVIEIFVMFFLIIVVFTARIPQYFKPFFTYLTTKFIMSCGLIYFYYRVLVVFLPISSILGPMIISIRRMASFFMLT